MSGESPNTYKILAIDSYTVVIKSTQRPIQTASMNLDNFNELVKNGEVKIVSVPTPKMGDIIQNKAGVLYAVMPKASDPNMITLVNKETGGLTHNIPIDTLKGAIASGGYKSIPKKNRSKKGLSSAFDKAVAGGTDLEVGDYIYVYDGSGNILNYHWKVTDIDNGGVRLQNSSTGEIITTQMSNIQHGVDNGVYSINDVNKKQRPPKNSINKGDTVICINDDMLPFGTKITKGNSYIVKDITLTSIGATEMLRLMDDNNKSVNVRADRFEKYTSYKPSKSRPKFKVGDHVTFSGFNNNPMYGKIISQSKWTGLFTVEYDYNNDKFLVKLTTDQMEHEYKI